MVTEVFPLAKRILAAEIKKEQKSSSGIILEGVSSMKETASAKVLAVGPEVKSVKVGDEIYIDWTKTRLVVIDNAQRVIFEEEDILAVVVTG